MTSPSENPLKRPQSRFLQPAEVRLLQIVGVLFDSSPNYSRIPGDAVLERDSSILDRVELAFKVDGDSALPLAINGQMILGGARLLPTELAGKEGRIIAIATSDGCVLKRVGKVIPGAPHLRMFESVGGLGESMLICTEDIEENRVGNLPLLHSAREVLGVLYELG